jgi:hypothetical protein
VEVESTGVHWTVGIIEGRGGLITGGGGLHWTPLDCGHIRERWTYFRWKWSPLESTGLWAYYREVDLFQVKVESTGVHWTVSIIEGRGGLITDEGGVWPY